jgi:hypothetical protein
VKPTEPKYPPVVANSPPIPGSRQNWILSTKIRWILWTGISGEFGEASNFVTDSGYLLILGILKYPNSKQSDFHNSLNPSHYKPFSFNAPNYLFCPKSPFAGKDLHTCALIVVIYE